MAQHPFAAIKGWYTGVWHGAAMVLNHLTLNSYTGWLDVLGVPLDGYVNRTIAENGGLYYAADWGARVGAHSLQLIGVIEVGYAAGWARTSPSPGFEVRSTCSSARGQMGPGCMDGLLATDLGSPSKRSAAE